MNKDIIINKIVKDLPIKEMRSQMSDVEWFGWFEECWDKAINYTRCSTQLKDETSHDFKYWYTVNGYTKIDEYNFKKETAIISKENLYKKWRKKINPLIV